MRLFLRRHREWIVLIVAGVATLVSASAYGISRIEDASKGPAYRLASSCIRVNQKARRELGVITGFGFTVAGAVVENTDATGTADITFDVLGSWRSGQAHVTALRRAGVWELTGASMRVDGQRIRLTPSATVGGRRALRFRRLCAPPSSTTSFRLP